MKSGWDERQARVAIERYAREGVGEDLALRTYSARLLGADPALVLHGGGNTSVKTRALDLFGEEIDVLCVKGSGWDLATIEPPGHPAVRLDPLLRMRSLQRLCDEDMVNAQRQNLLDAAAPNPSVETLLHAFIPAKFIDHTHAMAVLALANQPDAQALLAHVYGDRVACVAYVMPGFDLAKAAADAFESREGLEGLILINHGVFSFGATARESYERMIDLVSLAEAYIDERSGAVAAATSVASSGSECFPVLRGLLARKTSRPGRERWVFDCRQTRETRALVDDPRLSEWASRGVATPDHVIRTKRHPLVLPAPGADLAAWGARAAAALDAYVDDYEAYFADHAPKAASPKTRLDPLPRVVAIPGVGLVGLGRNATEAKVVADIAEAWTATLLRAEAIGRSASLRSAVWNVVWSW
jgi:rhamnose utilization protein RhaD (predicted bifunctional aldolase and dehydrogenase)